MSATVKNILIYVAVFIAGALLSFFVQQYLKQQALLEAALQANVVREQLLNTIRDLQDTTNAQAVKIQDLSNVFSRVSSTLNEEVDSMQKALSLLRDLKDLVRMLP